MKKTNAKVPKTKKTTEELKAIPLTNISIGKTNPRKFFDEDALNELAESIALQGLLQPILVRPLAKGKFELVCGERRYRACEIAKIKLINAVARELTDNEVLEMQITENLQRQDVHPLDEASAIKMLMDNGSSKDDVAKRLGVSLKYITHRLQLNELIPEIAEIYYQDRMKISVALNIATLVKSSQIELFQEHYKDWKDDKDFSIKSLGWEFNQLKGNLNKATFELENPSLNNKCACMDCPLNSMNRGLLFPEKDKEPICLDIVCFKGKTEHQRNNFLELAKTNSLPIVKEYSYISNEKVVEEELTNSKLNLSKGSIVEIPVILDFEAYCEENLYLDKDDEDYKEDLKQAKSDYKEWVSETKEEINEIDIAFQNGEIVEGLKVDSNGNYAKSLIKLDGKVAADGGAPSDATDELEKAKSLEIRRRELDYEKMQSNLHSSLKVEYTSLNSKLLLDEKIAYVIALLSKLPWDSNNYLLLSTNVTGYDKSKQIYEAYKKDASKIDSDIAMLSRMLIVECNYFEASSIRKSKTYLSLFEAFKTQLSDKVEAVVEEMKITQEKRQDKFKTKLSKLVENVDKTIAAFNKKNPL